MQTELKQGKLLNEKGELNQKGWAKDLILEYNRENVANKFRLKEWDYYCVLSENKGFVFNIVDLRYLGLVSVTFLDFDAKKQITKDFMIPLTFGKFNLKKTTKSGDVIYKNSKISLKYLRQAESRVIEIDCKNFVKGKNLSGKITLQQPETLETTVLSIPFTENKHAFYYNHKINCMPAEGEIILGDKKITFNPENSFGNFDWGRGVWTYKNMWYWGTASGKVNDKLFGFNIGYGFGDVSAASENTIIYDGKIHKFDRLEFIIPQNMNETWKMISNDNRFEMTFEPLIDKHTLTNALIIKSDQHQLFGKYSGKAVLDDGTELKIENLLGSAEKFVNKW